MQTNEPNTTTPPTTAEDTQSSLDTTDRRSFLKGAAIVAGAAATGILATASGADAAVLRARPLSSVRIAFPQTSRLSLQQLHDAIDEVLNQAGCPTCGLVGFDIRLETVLPLESKVGAIIVAEEGLLR